MITTKSYVEKTLLEGIRAPLDDGIGKGLADEYIRLMRKAEWKRKIKQRLKQNRLVYWAWKKMIRIRQEALQLRLNKKVK